MKLRGLRQLRQNRVNSMGSAWHPTGNQDQVLLRRGLARHPLLWRDTHETQLTHGGPGRDSVRGLCYRAEFLPVNNPTKPGSIAEPAYEPKQHGPERLFQ